MSRTCMATENLWNQPTVFSVVGKSCKVKRSGEVRLGRSEGRREQERGKGQMSVGAKRTEPGGREAIIESSRYKRF